MMDGIRSQVVVKAGRGGFLNQLVAAIAVGVTVVIVSSSSLVAQDVRNPTHNSLAGARLFNTVGCSNCHAMSGQGGDIGPDLGDHTGLRTFYELAADMWNHLPQMVSRMASIGMTPPHLEAREIGDIIAFLYSVDYFDQPGDSAAGASLFRSKNCITCHQVGGMGGVVGRDLTFFGRLGSPIEIAAAMWNHGTGMSEAMEERGIARAMFSGSELVDLIEYIRSVSPAGTASGVYVLPGRAEEGRVLFVEKKCENCHSVRGQGGNRGPDLAEQGRNRSLTQFAAAMWNKAPSMEREMSRMGITRPQLDPVEIADIVAYLYSVRYFRESGSIQTGRRRIRDKGCLDCHSLDGVGASTASELSRTAGLGSPPAVIAALWNHVGIDAVESSARVVVWPAIDPDEMADLVAFFMRTSQGD